MIDLARDLAHNKGMSLIFSSHLLPDVEAVCDHVLVLGRGSLLAQGAIATMKEAHPGAYEVRLKGDAGRFVERLRAAGGDAEPHGDGLLVRLRDGQTLTALWQIAAELGEQVRSLRPQRSTLEEVFLKAIGEKA